MIFRLFFYNWMPNPVAFIFCIQCFKCIRLQVAVENTFCRVEFISASLTKISQSRYMSQANRCKSISVECIYLNATCCVALTLNFRCKRWWVKQNTLPKFIPDTAAQLTDKVPNLGERKKHLLKEDRKPGFNHLLHINNNKRTYTHTQPFPSCLSLTPLHAASGLAACKSDSSVFHYCNEGPASAKGCLALRQNKLGGSRTTGPFPKQRREGEREREWGEAEEPCRSSLSLPFYCHFMSQCVFVFLECLRYACVWPGLDKGGRPLRLKNYCRDSDRSGNVEPALRRLAPPPSPVLYGNDGRSGRVWAPVASAMLMNGFLDRVAESGMTICLPALFAHIKSPSIWYQSNLAVKANWINANCLRLFIIWENKHRQPNQPLLSFFLLFFFISPPPQWPAPWTRSSPPPPASSWASHRAVASPTSSRVRGWSKWNQATTSPSPSSTSRPAASSTSWRSLTVSRLWSLK